jgi:hypothetical protein
MMCIYAGIFDKQLKHDGFVWDKNALQGDDGGYS